MSKAGKVTYKVFVRCPHCGEEVPVGDGSVRIESRIEHEQKPLEVGTAPTDIAEFDRALGLRLRSSVIRS